MAHVAPRLLHVVASTDRRGAESAALELSTRLNQLGCEGSIAALEPGSVGGLDIPLLGRSRFSRRGLSRLRDLAGAVDVVVAHGSSTLPAVSVATAGLRAPFVYRSIGDPRSWMTSRARRVRVMAFASRAAGVVALWREAAVFWHDVLRVPADRITVIPNWVDARRFRFTTPQAREAARAEMGLPPGRPLAVCLSALTEEKRIDLAIRTVGAMQDWTLLIVGDGPDRGALAALASRWPSRVRLLGTATDPRPVLASADVLLMPSRTEGQPAVAIEAGLSGLPVVASRVGGLPEIVLHGQTGILVDRPSPSTLADGMSRALDKREVMGAAAHQHCLNHFDLARIGPLWLDLLQRIHTG